jgi:hypothetical protein
VLPPQRLVSALIAVCALALVVACDVGAVPLEVSGGGGPDGGAGGGPDPAGGGTDDPDGGTAVPAACDEPVATNESGNHNAGQPCLDCHGGGGDAPTFRVGGTIYSALAGGTPVVGATVRMTDGNGAEHVAISARNGNFWLTEQVALPLAVQASSCPATLHMVAPSSVGNCNAGGCHDGDFRIHLP